MNSNTYDIAIIGAGNLGLWTARELAKRRAGRIAVLERAWAGFGATSRSGGMVRQQGGSETAVKLGKLSRRLYLELGQELGLHSGFIQNGYWILAETPEERDAFLELVEVRRRCGIENEWVDRDTGRQLFPWLNWDRFLGGTYTADDGYVHPPIAVRNITFATQQFDSVDLYEMCEVQGLEQQGDGYRLETTRGSVQADRVVDAGGPRGARAIASMLGIKVPVLAARHQIVTFSGLSGATPQGFPMFFALAQGVYVRPEEQGALLGMSNPEEQVDRSDRYQIGFDWEYYARVKPDWEDIFPALKGQPISRAWAASIDYTPDHLPIIEQLQPGFYAVAAGGHGMMWGPGLGAKTAELMCEGSISDLPEDEVTLKRFSMVRETRDAIALPFPREANELVDETVQV